MARPPKPWYWVERGTWMVTINGTRHKLGQEKEPALRAFHSLLAGGVLQTPPATPDVSFAALIDLYLKARQKDLSPGAHSVTSYYFRPFQSLLGSFPAKHVSTSNLESVITGHVAWNQTTRHVVINRMSTLYRWAMRAGLVDADPAVSIKRPKQLSRGPETLPTADDLERLLEDAGEALRAVLVCLHETGARPGEVIRVTAQNYDPAARVWILANHKTSEKTSRPRIIHLTDRVVDLCDRRVVLHPVGPLFRNHRGQPWSSSYRISANFRYLRNKLGLPKTVVPYSLRHDFVTSALAAGVSDSLVAGLVGHASTRMIHSTYAHLSEKARELKEALDQFRTK